MNTFGNIFRITLFGESHAEAAGIVIDGVPAGIRLNEEDLCADLERRRSGRSGTTRRHETDRPHIVTGTHNGHTTGTPLMILFENGDVRSADYAHLASQPRPSHADRVAAVKYGGWNNPAGGGIFSGRMTVAIVAAGVVAKKILNGVKFDTRITEIGGCSEPQQMQALLEECAAAGDSVGGQVRISVTGVATGWGEPFFDTAEGVIAHAVLSVPGVKGIEFGAGFEASRRRGSQNNDPIIDHRGTTASNNDGGINGGITNGNPLVVGVAFKPTPSIGAVQQTYDWQAGEVRPLTIGGRHDTCIALRGAVAAEAAVAIALADLKLQNLIRIGANRNPNPDAGAETQV